MLKSHDDMRVGRKISIFLGDISGELELDDYLSSKFTSDFGFEINPNDGPECDAQDRPVILTKLLEGFSQIDTFKDSVIRLAESKNIAKASCVILFYNFAYDSSLINAKNSGKMQFIGVVDYPGFS